MATNPYSFFAEQPSAQGVYRAVWREEDLSKRNKTPQAISVIELLADDGRVLETWEVRAGKGRKFSEDTMYTPVP